jgi:hypothetical protein
MSKSPRVTFKYNRIAEDDWQIEAHYPEPKFGTSNRLRARLKLTNGCREAGVSIGSDRKATRNDPKLREMTIVSWHKSIKVLQAFENGRSGS